MGRSMQCYQCKSVARQGHASCKCHWVHQWNTISCCNAKIIKQKEDAILDARNSMTFLISQLCFLMVLSLLEVLLFKEVLTMQKHCNCVALMKKDSQDSSQETTFSEVMASFQAQQMAASSHHKTTFAVLTEKTFHCALFLLSGFLEC